MFHKVCITFFVCLLNHTVAFGQIPFENVPWRDSGTLTVYTGEPLPEPYSGIGRLEWLSLRLTRGMSFESVAAMTGPGGTYELFRHATEQEIEGLMRGVFGVEPWITNPNQEMLDFISLVGINPDEPGLLERIGASGSSDAIAMMVGPDGSSSRAVTPKGAPSIGGSYLVREQLPQVIVSARGGNDFECTADGKTEVSFDATLLVDAGDFPDRVSWYLDGEIVDNAGGAAASILVPLGSHTVEARVITVLGESGSGSDTVIVEDTEAPQITAEIVDSKSGDLISVIGRSQKGAIRVDAFDACDPDPLTTITVGVPAGNGSLITASTPKKSEEVTVSVEGNTQSAQLNVSSVDSSGNVGTSVATVAVAD